MNKQEVIETLEKYRDTHVVWTKFLKGHPSFETRYVGDVRQHEKYVKGYDEIIEYVKETQED